MHNGCDGSCGANFLLSEVDGIVGGERGVLDGKWRTLVGVGGKAIPGGNSGAILEGV